MTDIFHHEDANLPSHEDYKHGIYMQEGAFRTPVPARSAAPEHPPAAEGDECQVPVMKDRPTPDPEAIERKVEHPWMPRAMRAVSVEHPEGTRGNPYDTMSVLQQHVKFFDRHHRGYISMLDTFFGFRELGFNVPFSILAMCIINFSLSYSTCPTLLPDPLFRVYIKNIHKAKHGSSSGVYDTEGRFIPSAFESIFSKYAKADERRQYLTAGEVWHMIKAFRLTADPFGWFAAFFEWGTTLLLVGERVTFTSDSDGGPKTSKNLGSELCISKEHIREIFDGSLFWRLQEERESLKAHKGDRIYHSPHVAMSESVAQDSLTVPTRQKQE
ncbi:Caleosin related protein-domain-containing protein [Blastocladiella britannica]|nr:Caleosin related protein-domain-containing protein [Blastocladiella britannica]